MWIEGERDLGYKGLDLGNLGGFGLRVSGCGLGLWGFPKIGVPPVIIHLQMGFSIINHLFWGSPIYGHLHTGD